MQESLKQTSRLSSDLFIKIRIRVTLIGRDLLFESTIGTLCAIRAGVSAVRTQVIHDYFTKVCVSIFS